MKHIVSYSGGIASFFTLKRVVKKYGKKNVIAVFCNTLSEDEDLYRFNDDVKNYFKGVEFISLSDGRDIWECAFEQKFLYNSRVANCTVFLKMRIFNKWLKENYKPNKCVIHLGFDWTELHRVEKSQKKYEPYKVECLLTKEPFLMKEELIDQLENEIGIKAPRLYKLGFKHNNCGGFCFKAGIGHFKHLLEKMPERYQYHEQKEQELIKIIKNEKGQDVAILNRVRNGTKQPLTLKDLRLGLETNKQLSFDELHDFGGCGCFI